jgi:DNA-binding GntR family transcriptional regulator
MKLKMTMNKRTERRQTPSQIRFWKIFNRIRKRIVLLDYPPGTRIEINKLAEEFTVSRTPIRSVLHRLEYEGLVVTNHGVGTTVTDIDFSKLRTIMAFRARLAEMIGQLNPLSPSKKHMDELKALKDVKNQLIENFSSRKFGEIDLRLHQCIVELIGHPQLARVYDEMYYRTARMWFSFLPKLEPEEEVSILLNDIDTIAQAMQRGDTVAVGYILRNSIDAVIWRLAQYFGMEGDSVLD